MNNTRTVTLPSGVNVEVYIGAKVPARKMLDYQTAQKDWMLDETPTTKHVNAIEQRLFTYPFLIKSWTATYENGTPAPVPTLDNKESILDVLDNEDEHALWEEVNYESGWLNPLYKPTLREIQDEDPKVEGTEESPLPDGTSPLTTSTAAPSAETPVVA